MLDKLSKLTLEEKNLLRLASCSFDEREITQLLTRLKVVRREIKETKQKLRLERELKRCK